MLILLSPAKTLNENKIAKVNWNFKPYFQHEVEELVKILKKKTINELQKLMDVSPKIAELNFHRYQNFSSEFNYQNSKPAIFCFSGDVYQEMEVGNYKENDLEFAQNHLLILSGLYGVLRPLDLMQPYRLEMSTALHNKGGKNLYDFWGVKITNYINYRDNGDVVINLASQEYFEVINKNLLRDRLINVILKNKKDGKLRVIGILAKRARGMMANYIIKNKISNPQQLKNFSEAGYEFSEKFSTENDYVFISER